MSGRSTGILSHGCHSLWSIILMTESAAVLIPFVLILQVVCWSRNRTFSSEIWVADSWRKTEFPKSQRSWLRSAKLSRHLPAWKWSAQCQRIERFAIFHQSQIHRCSSTGVDSSMHFKGWLRIRHQFMSYHRNDSPKVYRQRTSVYEPYDECDQAGCAHCRFVETDT